MRTQANNVTSEEQTLLYRASVRRMEGKTISKIAKELGISEARAFRLLDRGEKAGILSVKYTLAPPAGDPELEAEARKSLQLKMVRTFPPSPDLLGIAAAAAFVDAMSPGGITVGVSGGKSVKALADMIHVFKDELRSKLNLPEGETHISIGGLCSKAGDRDFVRSAGQVAGYLIQKINEIDLRALAARVSLEKGARPIELLHPFKNFKLDALNAFQVLFVGLGTLSPHDEMATERVKVKDRSQTVGELLFQPFDREGRVVETADDPDIATVPLKILQQYVAANKDCIAISSGLEKAESIYYACRHKFVSGLVSDVDTVREVLKRV